MKKYRRERIFYHHGDKLLTKLTLPTISIKRYIPNVYIVIYLFKRHFLMKYMYKKSSNLFLYKDQMKLRLKDFNKSEHHHKIYPIFPEDLII